MTTELTGQLAIISGGLGDIGSAIAIELAARGASVAIGDLRAPEAADELFAKLKKQGTHCHYHRANTADPGHVREWVAAVEKDLGTPTLIIPNAATATIAPTLEMTPEQWSAEIGVNLNGAFYFAQACARRLIEKKLPGRIVFIGSWAAHAPHPIITAYCAAKAGLRMLAKCMALELAPHNILVNEVAPGYVDAGLSGQVWKRNPGAREKAMARVPTGKLITPDEVAYEVAHLCDPKNQHMTGATLLMDGGLSLFTPAKLRDEK